MSILICEETAAASLSSCNMNNDTASTTGAICYPPQYHLMTSQYQNPQQHDIKKKRNQPGKPDPEAEVIALSPNTLVATNRYFCEICNKGFQRDQNLQLHRRGHNLPWKLKKRENKEIVRKKVYICPELSCVHHDPSRALGDLTGIKKHFSRKHGEKKWKCDKCSKRYAVQSDCKAHSKICGTREYKCECGTIFSRRDSFITHRAFCATLAVESSRISTNPITNFHESQSGVTKYNSTSQIMNFQFQTVPHYFNSHDLPVAAATFSMKREQPSTHDDNFINLRHSEIPPWLMTNCQPFTVAGPGPPIPPNNFSSPSIISSHNLRGESAAASMMQKVAQFGATISNKANAVSAAAYTDPAGPAKIPHINTHVSVTTSTTDSATNTKQTHQNLSSCEEELMTTTGPGTANIIKSGMMMMTSFSNFANGFEELYFNGTDHDDLNEEDMTKDFLGLRPISDHDDIFNIAALVNTTTTHQHEHDHFKNHI